MQTFDQSIFSLFAQGLITLDEALRWATNVDEFKLKVQGVSTTSDMSRDQMASSVFGKPGSAGAARAPEITRFGKYAATSDRRAAMDAYTTALTLLSRRELSTRQLRDRLTRRQFAPDDIEAAIARLTADRTLDDRRVAMASARLEAAVQRRGRRRVLQHVQQLGIDDDTAKTAVDEVFGDLDEAALLDEAVARRLRGQDRPRSRRPRPCAHRPQSGRAGLRCRPGVRASAARWQRDDRRRPRGRGCGRGRRVK